MLIVCPTCATSYEVDTASLRPNGRQVRCLRCGTVWHAALTHAQKLIAAAEALAPVRRTVEAMADAAAAEEARTPPPYLAAARGDDDPQADGSGPLAISGGDFPLPAAEMADVEQGSDDRAEVESPPVVPADLDAIRLPTDVALADEVAGTAEPLEDIETVAARRYKERRRRTLWRWPLTNLQSVILALVILDAIVVGWRADFVRALPQTASFYAWLGLPVNLRGVDFDGLATATEQHEGVPILVVQGNIVNDGHQMADVPRLRFAVRNAAREEIYSWTAVAPRGTLPPGEAVAFRTRLASPPPDAHDVLVRFVSRNDIISGAH